MELAKNQKGIKILESDEDIWNKVKSTDTKIIITFGPNGRGKSTIKDLIVKDKLVENFECEGQEQTNIINDTFKGMNYLIYDEEFISNIVYTNSNLHKNQLKVLMSTNNIEKLISKKEKSNKIIANIINTSNKYINKIENIISILNVKTPGGSITEPKKRFSSTFINEGEIHNKYEDIFTIPDDSHKEWWYQGLNIYKTNKIDYCPWCINSIDNIDKKIRENIESVNDVKSFNPKVFSEKQNKLNELYTIINDTSLTENFKGKISIIIDYLKESIDRNLQDKIITELLKICEELLQQKEIFVQIIERLKYIDNILDAEHITINNKLDKITLFKDNEELNKLSNNIDIIIKFCEDLQKETNDSNKELASLIKSDEDNINNILKIMGLKYKLSINPNAVISDKINDSTEYVLLESLNGKDVSTEINNTLSYGEKSTLAFAIFIQIVKMKADSNTLIIIDDPISSYDIFRRFTSLGLIKSFKNILYKKLFLFTHSSDFVASIINNFKGINALVLEEKEDSTIEIKEIEDSWFNETNTYRNILLYNENLGMKVLSLRLLHDIRKILMFDSTNMPIFDYLSKLIHYRKDDPCNWKKEYIKDLKTIYCYFGIEYDSNIEKIANEKDVFNSIDDLLDCIKIKNVYELSFDDIYSLRMICEKIVRDESNSEKKYKERRMWDIKDSKTKEKLEPFEVLLNSITHVDNDNELLPIINTNDIKSIPKFIINQLLNIVKGE